MTDAHDPTTGEVLDGKGKGALQLLQAAPEAQLAVRLAREELQVQMDQARAVPRSIHRAVDMINTLATLDNESAQSCIYSIPRDGKTIEGPSIRMAEIIAGCWGNNTYAGRVTDIGDKFVEAEGIHFDLETNSRVVKRVQRRITTSRGQRYGDDMIGVTGNAAISIALRNAVLSAVPRGVWMPAFLRVRQVVMGDIQTLANRRSAAVEAFTRFGVTEEQVCIALGVAGIKDITLELMVPLQGMFSALNSGEADPSEMFATVEKAPQKAKRLSEAHGKPAEPKPETKPAPATTESAKPSTDQGQGDNRPTETGSAPAAEPSPDTSGSAGDASSSSAEATPGATPSGESQPGPEQTRAATPEEVKAAVEKVQEAETPAEEKAAASAAGKTQPEDPALASQGGGTGGGDLFPGDAPSPKDAARARAAAESTSLNWPDVVDRVSPEDALEQGFYHLSGDKQNAHGQRPYYDDQGRCRGVCNTEAARLEEFGDHPSSLRRDKPAEKPADAAPPPQEDAPATDGADPFQAYRDNVEEATEWANIKEAFLRLAATPEFKGAGPARWREESIFAWRKAEDLMRKGDELDYSHDLLAFRLYVEAAPNAQMVQGGWMKVTQGAAYKNLQDAQKTQLGRTVAARIEELNAAG